MTAAAPLRLTPHFMLVEFASRDGTPVPPNLILNLKFLSDQLEVLRTAIGKPIRIVSGYRSPEWNAHVKGAAKSQHLLGKAADIRIAGELPGDVFMLIERLIKAGKMHNGGVGQYPSWVHYDVRAKPARW